MQQERNGSDSTSTPSGRVFSQTGDGLLSCDKKMNLCFMEVEGSFCEDLNPLETLVPYSMVFSVGRHLTTMSNASVWQEAQRPKHCILGSFPTCKIQESLETFVKEKKGGQRRRRRRERK
jgi:hypothetical protein